MSKLVYICKSFYFIYYFFYFMAHNIFLGKTKKNTRILSIEFVFQLLFFLFCPVLEIVDLSQWSWYGVFKFEIQKKNFKSIVEVGRGAAARSVTVKPTGCGFDPHSRRWNILKIYICISSLWCRGYPAVCGIQREAKKKKV